MCIRDRDIKIDILEGYIRTSERFRVIRVFFGVPESYGNSPEEVVGLNGPYGKGEKGLKGWPPPMASPNWTREGAAPPLFPSPSPTPSLSPLLEKEGDSN